MSSMIEQTTLTPVQATPPVQPVTFNPEQKNQMPPFDDSVPGSYEYVETENGNYVKNENGNYVQVAPGEGDYDYEFVPKMTSSRDVDGDESVMNKTNLYLEWMQDHPGNTNGPEVFLLYLSNLEQAGVFKTNPELETSILSIHNGATPPKTLVQECVDITMMQMCMNGSTPAEAQATIDALFPLPTDGSKADGLTLQVRAEASAECAALSVKGAIPSSEMDLAFQWSNFILDPTTQSTLAEAQKSIRMDTYDMIVEGSPGLFSAYINLIMWLMLLLSAQSTIKVNGYGDTLDWLNKESAELTAITNQWSEGFGDPGDMGSVFTQYPNGDYMYYNHYDGSYVTIKNQKVDANGDPMFTDAEGNMVVQKKDGNYYYTNGTKADQTNTFTPVYATGGYKATNDGTILSVKNNGESAYNWLAQVQGIQTEVNESPFLSDATKESFNEQCDIILNQPGAALNYKYQDVNGNNVSKSGQAENDDGYLLYQTYYKGGGVCETLYYNPEDGKYYADGSNPPAQQSKDVGNGGQGTPQAVYYDKNGNLTQTKSNAAPGTPQRKSAEGYQTLYVNNNGQRVNEDGQLVNGDGYLLYNNGAIYQDGSGTYFNASDNSKVSYGTTVTPAYGTDSTHSANPLTLQDQAYGYTDKNGNWHNADYATGLTTSLQIISQSDTPGVDEDGKVIGSGYGSSAQNLAISNALGAMSKLMTDQSSTITTQISQETNNDQLYLKTFSQMITGDQGSLISMATNSVNGQIPR